VKGSKITPNGKETTACSTFKRIAIIPLSDLGEEKVPPMLLRLAQTSMWDKNNDENEAKGYYAWDQYLDMLRTRGAVHTGVVATKVRFDSRVAYPKLLFAASRWLADEELELVKPLFKDERVAALLQAPETAVAARAPAKSTTEDESPDDVATTKPTKAAAPPPNPEDFDDEPAPPPKGRKAAPPPVDEEEPAPPVTVKGKGKAKAAPVEPEPDDEAPPPVATKGKGKPAAAGNGKGKGMGLGDLVDEWDSP
jgi:hypothetical protein